MFYLNVFGFISAVISAVIAYRNSETRESFAWAVAAVLFLGNAISHI